MLEMGTFLAILLGTLAGGVLAASHGIGTITSALIAIAAAGLLLSLMMPRAARLRSGAAHRLESVDVDDGRHPHGARIAHRFSVGTR